MDGVGGASAAAGGADGGTAVEETPATKGGKGGKRDLQEAYREVREMLTDPSRLVRAVASGKAKGADPEWRRLEMRPVALKGGVKLQVVKYDARQAFTSNHAYAGAATAGPRGRRGRRATGADPSRTGADPSRTAQWGHPTRTEPSTRRCDAALATGASRRPRRCSRCA